MEYTVGNRIEISAPLQGTWVGGGRRVLDTEIHPGTYKIVWIGNNRVRIAEVFEGGATSSKYVYLLKTDELLTVL